MTATLTLTVTYQPTENGWIQARIRELPAVITAAPTAEQATEMLVDALREYLLALESPGESPADASTGRLTVTIAAA